MFQVDEHRFSPDGLVEATIDLLIADVDDELLTSQQAPRLVPDPELDERRERRERRQARRTLALIAGAGRRAAAEPVERDAGGEAA
jgi:hypothetical protein